MSAAESAPAVSRPEGGEVERLARAFHEVRRNLDDRILPWNLVGEHLKADYRARAQAFLTAPREPEPVMEPLPTEPCAIRATVRGVEGVVLIGPGEDGEWRDDLGRCWWANVHEITAYERLLSRAEWEAEQADEGEPLADWERELLEQQYEKAREQREATQPAPVGGDVRADLVRVIEMGAGFNLEYARDAADAILARFDVTPRDGDTVRVLREAVAHLTAAVDSYDPGPGSTPSSRFYGRVAAFLVAIDAERGGRS